jgi:hypothetical protein
MTIVLLVALVIAGAAFVAMVATGRRPRLLGWAVAIGTVLLLPPATIIGFFLLDPRCSTQVIAEQSPPGGLKWRIAREECTNSDRVPHLVHVRSPDGWIWRLAAEFDPPFMPLGVEQFGSSLSIRYRTATGAEAVDIVALSGAKPQRVGGRWDEPRVLGRRF